MWQTLAGVKHLNRLQADLCAHGCLLFENWRVEVYCDRNKGASKPSVTITVSEGQIFGYESVEEAVDSLRRFLEGCFNKWLQFAEVVRVKYKYLNFYKTAQLSCIRKELPKFEDDPYEQKSITTLLKYINLQSLPERITKSRYRKKKQWLVTRIPPFDVGHSQR